MMMKNFDLPEPYPCKECQAGIVHPLFITYFTWLNDELITVPNFPAWVCDLCGKREYDQKAISWLTMLLKPQAGETSEQSKKPQHPQHLDNITPSAIK